MAGERQGNSRGCWFFMYTLNAELNPICQLLALIGGATIVVVSRLRVKGSANLPVVLFDASGEPHLASIRSQVAVNTVGNCNRMASIILYYNIMRLLSCMQSIR